MMEIWEYNLSNARIAPALIACASMVRAFSACWYHIACALIRMTRWSLTTSHVLPAIVSKLKLAYVFILNELCSDGFQVSFLFGAFFPLPFPTCAKSRVVWRTHHTNSGTYRSPSPCLRTFLSFHITQ
jgi:hypothetical protein